MFRRRTSSKPPKPPAQGLPGRESSRYGGLEREVSIRNPVMAVNGNGSALPAAVVHEGPVSRIM